MAQNLTLGRGELHFAQFFAGTLNPQGERYLGNSPEFSATIETENLDHFDSDHGVNEKDESIPLSTNRTGGFTTDNISADNIALFFFGEKVDFVVAGGSVTAELHNNVSQGLTYPLGTTPTNPTGARNISAVVVKDAVTTTTTYIAGTDYTVDLAKGRLTVLASGAIEDGDSLSVAYTVAPSTRERVISGSKAISGALRYIAFNPAGPQKDWFMPYVKISPNGDYTLKGDDWQTIPFSIEILKKTGLEAIYIDGEAFVPNP